MHVLVEIDLDLVAWCVVWDVSVFNLLVDLLSGNEWIYLFYENNGLNIYFRFNDKKVWSRK